MFMISKYNIKTRGYTVFFLIKYKALFYKKVYILFLRSILYLIYYSDKLYTEHVYVGKATLWVGAATWGRVALQVAWRQALKRSVCGRGPWRVPAAVCAALFLPRRLTGTRLHDGGHCHWHRGKGVFLVRCGCACARGRGRDGVCRPPLKVSKQFQQLSFVAKTFPFFVLISIS